jgi:hypothetical protein
MKNFKKEMIQQTSQVFGAAKRPVLNRCSLSDNNTGSYNFYLNGPSSSKEGIITLSGFRIVGPGIFIQEIQISS